MASSAMPPRGWREGFRRIVIVLALLPGLAVIHCRAPDVERKFAFTTSGGVFSAGLSIAAPLAFSFYTRNFLGYDTTYGSIAAVIVLMLWLYMVGLAILVGSEINALLERYGWKGKRKRENRQGERRDGGPKSKPAP